MNANESVLYYLVYQKNGQNLKSRRLLLPFVAVVAATAGMWYNDAKSHE